MTARHGEWHLVGYDSDPIPVSEWDIQQVEGDMRDRSNDAADMRSVLEKLADLDGWRGEAAEAFVEKADEVLEDLGNVVDRYDRLAEALSAWASDVDTARDATWRALEDAEAADDAIRSNPEHTGEGDPPDNQDTLDSKREDGEDNLGAARTAMQNAMADFDEAAGKAKDAIEEAADIWDDGFWGNFKGWIRDNADVIAKIVQVLEIAAFVLGAVLLVVAIVASAPFALVAAAVAVGLMVAVGQAMLAYADTGKADWGDVAWSLVGVVATVAGGKLASLAGKGLTKLVGTASTRIGAAARSSALSRLVGNSRVQFQNALRIANPRNNLARWAQGLRSTATAEGNAAAQAVDDVLKLQPSRLATALFQDRGLAGLNRSLAQLRTMNVTPDELANIANIQRQVWGAGLSNIVNNGIWAKDIPKNIGSIPDVVTNPPWSTQPAN